MAEKPSFFYWIGIQTELEQPFNQIDLYIDPIDYNIWIPSMDSYYNVIHDGYIQRITQKCEIDTKTKLLLEKLLNDLVNNYLILIVK